MVLSSSSQCYTVTGEPFPGHPRMPLHAEPGPQRLQRIGGGSYMSRNEAPRARRRVPGALRETAPAVGGEDGVALAPPPEPPLLEPEPEPEPEPPVGEAEPPPLEPPAAPPPGIWAWGTFFAALA